MVSHDLKSPLRSISALLSWTKEDFAEKIGEESLTNLNMMKDKVEKMDKLISDILNYSSIGAHQTEKVEVNTDVLVQDLIKILYVPEHISIVVNKTLPTLKADKVKLQQLFQNLFRQEVFRVSRLVQLDASCLSPSRLY